MLSATPLRNCPQDIKNQLLLFQDGTNANIENITDLERFFAPLIAKFNSVKKELKENKDKNKGKKKLKQLEKPYLKAFFKNSNIYKYITDRKSTNKILYLTGKEKIKTSNIIRHLQNFKENLQERREVHKGSREWWALWWARNQDIFESPKIVAPQRSKTNTFAYNECEWYASADVYFITQLDKDFNLKYILALLNSKLYYFWLYHKGKRKGENLELYQIPLSEIPIKYIEDKEQRVFVDLIDKILTLKSKNVGSDTNEFESQIDSLVYKLYNLTDDEIKIVEGEN